MNYQVLDLIECKIKAGDFSSEEIEWLVGACHRGEIPDDQLAALLMAITINKMSEEETESLGQAMAELGQTVSYRDSQYPVVGVFSSGGVGDKAGLCALGLVAAYGVPLAVLDQPAMGHIGGTITKLESIPGYKPLSSAKDYENQLRTKHMAVAVCGSEFCPGEPHLNRLRERTGTLGSIPLLCASLLARMRAAGVQGAVVDIKVGSGALLDEMGDARKLASDLMHCAKSAGCELSGFVTSMNQPLGATVGNALEIQEVISVLQGQGPQDVTELALTLAAQMLVQGQKAVDLQRGRELASDALSTGQGLEKFKELIALGGGDVNIFQNPDLLPTGPRHEIIRGLRQGFVKHIDARAIGLAVAYLGACPIASTSGEVDHRVGVKLHKKVGEKVQADEPLVTIYYSEKSQIDDARRLVEEAYLLSPNEVQTPHLIQEHLRR